MAPFRLTPLALMLVTSSLLTGCVTAPNKDSSALASPEWITQIPESRGMAYGTGSAEIYGNKEQALKQAENNARADLVSRLRVTIDSTTNSAIRESTSNGQTQVQKELSYIVSTRTPKVTLDEVSLADSYFDGKYAYAMVELDRTATAARLSRQMGEIELELMRFVEAPANWSTPLEKLQQQLPALSLFAEYDQLADYHAFVSTRRTSEPLSPDLSDFRNGILTTLKQLKVNLTFASDTANQLNASLTAALTDQGINIGQFDSPDLVFKIDSELDHHTQEARHYVFATSSISVMDGKGKILSSFSKKAKGVSGIKKSAMQKASGNLGKAVSEELAKTLASRLD